MAARRTKKGGITYKSRYESVVAQQIADAGLPILYEEDVLPYTVPERQGKYNPDFKIRDKTYIESKGKWDADDRKKHVLLKEQLGPKGYKIYIVFMNAYQKIRKNSKTTYAAWCDKHGIEYSHQVIKPEWLISDEAYEKEGKRRKEALFPFLKEDSTVERQQGIDNGLEQVENIRHRKTTRRKRKSSK